jgi:hypothetical protein
MVLRKKNSRIITVENVRYRWVISPNNGYCVLVVQKDEVAGSKLEVYFNTDINSFWVTFPNVADLNLKLLKPKEVESIIRQALEQGWKPDERNNSLAYDLIDDRLREK